MSKYKFPIAAMRDDKTPAIWLTHDHWLLLEPGIVRAYIENREYRGRRKARNNARQTIGGNWRAWLRLKSWEFMDSFPMDETHSESALALFHVGYQSYNQVCQGSPHRWTPEKLQAIGDKLEAKANADEFDDIVKEGKTETQPNPPLKT